MPVFPNILKTVTKVFRPRPVKRTAQSLYLSCVNQSRLPVFYLDYGIEDDIGARFELLTFHVGLVVTHLKSLSANDPRREQATDTAQGLFDAFLLALDTTLREQGVGDLSVPKKMKKLGVVIYTRMKRWDDLRGETIDDQVNYAARTLYAGAGYDNETDNEETLGDQVISPHILHRSHAFAIYAQSAREALSVNDILAGRLDWPLPAVIEAEADAPELAATN